MRYLDDLPNSVRVPGHVWAEVNRTLLSSSNDTLGGDRISIPIMLVELVLTILLEPSHFIRVGKVLSCAHRIRRRK